MSDNKNMGVESSPQSNILSSTGAKGLDTRPDKRIYWNVPGKMESPERVLHGFNRLEGIQSANPKRKEFEPDKSKRREVMRFISSNSAAQNILNDDNPLSSRVEVALQVGEDEWYISLARNGENRISPTHISQLVEDTRNPETPKSPVDSINKVLAAGNSFVSDLSSPYVAEQVLDLWKGTFGWTGEEVEGLAMRLQSQEESLEPKNVWFSALEKPAADSPSGKEVVAAGMAERLTFDLKDGRKFHIIELTEWASDEKSQGNGYMTAVITQTIAQVLASIPEDERDNILIMAETNIKKYAHRAGFGAGLRRPEHSVYGIEVPQILQQNVRVNGEMSDFAFVSLRPDTIKRDYPAPVVKQIMQTTAKQTL